MQYGFYVNQKAMSELGLELNYDDIAVFEFIKSYAHSSKVERLDVDGRDFYWVSWKLVVEELPYLGVKSRYGVINHINNLIDAGLLERYDKNATSGTGKSFFAFGKRYDEFVGLSNILNPCCQNSTPPVEKNQHNHNTILPEDINIKEKASPKTLPVNKFYISSTQRASVLNDPDAVAEIKRRQFVERAREDGHSVGMDKDTFYEFVDYWCEHSLGSENIRCESERFFDVRKRMATWMSRKMKRSPMTQQQPQTPKSKPKVWTQEELEKLYK